MGLFGSRKKSGVEKAINGWAKRQQKCSDPVRADEDRLANAIAKQLVFEMVGSPPTPEEVAEMEKRKRLAEEGARTRKERILALGVDPRMFSKAKVKACAIGFLDEFAPLYKRLSVDFEKARVDGDYPNLTRTGKLPKNVHTASFCAEAGAPINRPQDSVIMSISYLRDGIPNLVDMHLWHNHIRHGVFIRPSENGYQITCVERVDNRTAVRDTLFLNTDHDLAKGDPKAILAASMGRILR